MAVTADDFVPGRHNLSYLMNLMHILISYNLSYIYIINQEYSVLELNKNVSQNYYLSKCGIDSWGVNGLGECCAVVAPCC